LGCFTIKVIETPGPTKCSLTFYTNNETLYASESTGPMGKNGNMYPVISSSFPGALESIRKCQEINPKEIISPHFGFVPECYKQDYWQKCVLSTEESKDFILKLVIRGMARKKYWLNMKNIFTMKYISLYSRSALFGSISRP